MAARPRRNALTRTLKTAVRERRQAFVQEEVLNAATALFAKRGYRAVSMDEIAEHIGFGKSSIYYYYPSKVDLLCKIFDFILDSYISKVRERIAAGEPPERTLADLLRQHILFLAAHKDWSIVFTRDAAELPQEKRREVVKREREYAEMFEAVFRNGIQAGVFRNLPAEIAVNGMLGMCNWMITWYDEERRGSAQVIADQFISLLTEGYVRK
jgi:AcrR family transcriptional regulator